MAALIYFYFSKFTDIFWTEFHKKEFFNNIRAPRIFFVSFYYEMFLQKGPELIVSIMIVSRASM